VVDGSAKQVVYQRIISRVCRFCQHIQADVHFVRTDQVVEGHNEVYYKPADKMLNKLCDKGWILCLI
jgi:hypothetical protein